MCPTTLRSAIAPAIPESAAAQSAEPLVFPRNTRPLQEHYFAANDGAQLFYRYWPAVAAPGTRAIVLLHRGHEHSARMQHLVEELALPGFAMFAWDARGHGRSTSPAGKVPSFATLVKDLDSFIQHISAAYGLRVEDIALVGQSVGSVLAATWAHDYAPKIRCMVLSAPAFRIKLYAPFAYRILGLLHWLRGDFEINSYVKPRVLTHDPERIASYQTDPLIKRPISVGLLLGLDRTSKRVVEDAQAIHVPTQLLISGQDWVVRRKPQLDFFARLGTPVKEQHTFDDFFHDVLGERDRRLAVDKVRSFVLKAFVSPVQRPHLLDADKTGFTKTEYDELGRPLPLLSRKRLRVGLSKLALKLGGLLSSGIRMGFSTGFDSGSTLDYVYRNQACGATPIRRLVDRSYINAIGWKGIRKRKENLVQALLDAITRLHDQGMPVRLLDIAAGHGRYVLEALERCRVEIDDVRLRDLNESNIERGLALVKEKQLRHNVHFEKGDAFDRASLAALQPRPTLAVVSGLYELFPENAPVQASLAGLAEAIKPGGFLIYTGQPFHPQLEMIARTLPSHRGFRPWIMRRRTQSEMDQLVETAGFRKLDQQIDEWGIFTVSIAQKLTD